jgi:mevalonate kinase
MITEALGTGWGKLILCGEHAVVHGHPAIALAVDRGTTVSLRQRPGPTVVESPHVDERVEEALRTVLDAEGWHVRVATNLPVGRGMGSSAALAVALVRARAGLEGRTPSPDEVFREAMPIERTFHGNPSGVDVLISAHGGCRWFRRGDPPEHQPLVPGPWQLVVMDSGEAGDTAVQVAAVTARRPAIDPLLDEIGELVHQAREALQDPVRLGKLLTRNHELLVGIGVSNDKLDHLVELALSHGALGAKLAGAGGGGVVLALVERPEPLLAAALERGIESFGCAPWTG